MRIHSIDKIKNLKQLRKKGYSINELVKELSIPKTTVWHHVHNIIISPKYALLLKSKQGGSAKRSQQGWERARDYARKLLCSPHREYAIAIATLYWGEGSKKVCEFINSDGRMIKLYLILLEKLFNISKVDTGSIKPTMRIFSGMDKKESLKYWSDITGITKGNFLVRFNDGGKRGKTKHGMCRITVRKGGYILKILHSLIGEIFNEMTGDK